jgi:hypothetical protein
MHLKLEVSAKVNLYPLSSRLGKEHLQLPERIQPVKPQPH